MYMYIYRKSYYIYNLSNDLNTEIEKVKLEGKVTNDK